MPKYKVTIREECTYEVEVEADNEDAAYEAGIEALVQAPDMNVFFVSCDERDVEFVEEVNSPDENKNR
jgi:hypothetical protein